MAGPDLQTRPDLPAPEGAVDALVAALADCVSAPLQPHPLALMDAAVAQAQARRFKLDLSFRLGRDGAAHARFSVNDKGEPEAFRGRIRSVLPPLGFSARAIEAFFALSPPGEVQTTLSLKWGAAGGRPLRVGLYYEELMALQRAPALIGAVLGLGAGVLPLAPPPGALPAAVCADLGPDGFVGARDYWLCEDGEGEARDLGLPGALQAFRHSLPLHSHNRCRRFLLARRAGARSGSKLLWVTEAQHPDSARAAWGTVQALLPSLELPDSAPMSALEMLRKRWPFVESDAYLYPDLVCLDVDGAGGVEALILYVSIK